MARHRLNWHRLGLDTNYLCIAARGAALVVQITVTGGRKRPQGNNLGLTTSNYGRILVGH